MASPTRRAVNRYADSHRSLQSVTDDFVDQMREMVKPGTTTVALLAENIDPAPVLAELERFQGGRYVTGNLSLDAIKAVREALGDPAATTGTAPFPPPTPAEDAPNQA